MIRAIIFDCFGVLTTDGWLPFKKQHFGHDPELLQEATDLNKQNDGGQLDRRTYMQRLADLAQVPLQKVRTALEENAPNEKLIHYIETTLKPKYKIGMLSNAAGDWRDRLFGPERAKLFDAVALSYETGVTKPDERAYRIMAERLGVEPEECIFVDDQERYCTAAKDVGMRAVYYQDFEQFKAELEALLNL